MKKARQIISALLSFNIKLYYYLGLGKTPGLIRVSSPEIW